MEVAEREELEREIRRRTELGDLNGAATIAFRGYGPELYGFLVAFQRDEQSAADVFSELSERIWKGLAKFGWQSSFRTWAYAVARNASITYQRDARRRARHVSPLPEGSELSAIVDRIRTETAQHMRTETKTRVALFRESLPQEDRELLVLRVDKGLAWNELAVVLHEGDAPLGEADVKREAARLRKRFQLVKQRLLELGRSQGLLDERERGS